MAGSYVAASSLSSESLGSFICRTPSTRTASPSVPRADSNSSTATTASTLPRKVSFGAVDHISPPTSPPTSPTSPPTARAAWRSASREGDSPGGLRSPRSHEAGTDRHDGGDDDDDDSDGDLCLQLKLQRWEARSLARSARLGLTPRMPNMEDVPIEIKPMSLATPKILRRRAGSK